MYGRARAGTELKAVFKALKSLCSESVGCSGWVLPALAYHNLTSFTNLGIHKCQYPTASRNSHLFLCLWHRDLYRITKIWLWENICLPPNYNPSR